MSRKSNLDQIENNIKSHVSKYPEDLTLIIIKAIREGSNPEEIVEFLTKNLNPAKKENASLPKVKIEMRKK